MQTIRHLTQLLRDLKPVLNAGRYSFVTLPVGHALNLDSVVASIREPEGLSVVLPEQVARDYGLSATFVAAWITLTVNSDLAAVGLTAAVASALASKGISCNVVAGNHHDHLFVPYGQADAAIDALIELQQLPAA